VPKHADATHAEVTMQTESERIRIEVKDDGRGFEPGNISVDERKEGGFGLFNIRQKTAYLNGEFFIDSVVGVGTKVIITAPAR
jgi:signal transduction histidine kinase